jgi:hypothetical protein
MNMKKEKIAASNSAGTSAIKGINNTGTVVALTNDIIALLCFV